MYDDKNMPKDEKKETAKEVESKPEEQVEGSGIFTVDGKELPQIDGGWDIIGADSGLGDNEFEG